MNVAVPDPSEVLLFAVVGFAVVAQHTPFAVTEEPPSELMFPPDTAVVEVIEDAAVVVRTGTATEPVVNVKTFPYDVPALFVA